LKSEFVSECDKVLSSCGRLVSPPGVGFVDIPVGLQYQKFLPQGSADSTEEKLVETPAPFILKAFQAYATPASVGATYWRLRLPNGRFLHSATLAASEEFDIGSFRQTIDPPLECQPGGRFFFTTDGLLAAGVDVSITVILEGVIRYTLKGDAGGCGQPVGPNEPWASMARFTLDANQNLMAPEWRLGGQCYPETPAGCRDEVFTYLVPSSNAISVPCDGTVVANQPMFIGSDTDFVVRRLDFLTNFAPLAGGLLYVRIRDHSGYEITDGFCNAARISTVLFPSYWLKSSGRGGALFYDLMIVDGGGTTCSIQPVASGVKRRRVA